MLALVCPIWDRSGLDGAVKRKVSLKFPYNFFVIRQFVGPPSGAPSSMLLKVLANAALVGC